MLVLKKIEVTLFAKMMKRATYAQHPEFLPPSSSSFPPPLSVLAALLVLLAQQQVRQA